jgi:ABC-type multidrug transport system fused ATPase/permease subunit
VLLFDEATAAIDGASDAAFRAALPVSVLARGLRCVDGGASTLDGLDADHIIVLDKG